MLKRLARLVLIAAMLVLPVQGTAAALAHVMCARDDHHTGKTPDHANDHGAAHQHGNDAGGSGDGHSFQSCCHHIVTGAPLDWLAAASSDFPIYHATHKPLVSLFVPEQPQRPPRA